MLCVRSASGVAGRPTTYLRDISYFVRDGSFVIRTGVCNEKISPFVEGNCSVTGKCREQGPLEVATPKGDKTQGTWEWTKNADEYSFQRLQFARRFVPSRSCRVTVNQHTGEM